MQYVTRKTIKVLEQRNIPFVTLFDRLFGIGDQIEQLHDAMMRDDRMWKKTEKEWKYNMIKEKIAFARAFPDKKFVENAKKRYKKQQQEAIYKKYEQETDPIEAKKLENIIIRMENNTHITQMDIDQAKLFPIDQLVKVNERGFAQCVVHDDQSPSMYCKNNFAHCFVCGYRADSISLYMYINDVGFVDAVLALRS